MMSFGMNTARGRVSASLSVESFASTVHTQRSPSGVSRFFELVSVQLAHRVYAHPAGHQPHLQVHLPSVPTWWFVRALQKRSILVDVEAILSPGSARCSSTRRISSEFIW